MIDAVRHTSAKARAKGIPCGASLSASEERFTRLGALLHDIGHVAAGHTLEDELQLIGKHDEDRRLDQVLNGQGWLDQGGYTLANLIDREFEKYVPRDLRDKEIRASDILRLIVRKPPKKGEIDRFAEAQQVLDSSASIRMRVCCNMVGNTICADLLDYLHRDWYHVGKPRPFDERILQYMEVRTSGSMQHADLPPTANDTFVISLGKRPKIRTDAVSAILELLEWRYQLAESVLFHRTKLAATSMLDRALFELWKDRDPDEIEQIVLPLGDDELLSESRKQAEAQGDDSSKLAASLLASLEKREIHATLATFTHDDLPADIRSLVQRQYGDPEARSRVLTLLERDFKLPAGALTMYCPSSAAMNAKIAKVRIAIGPEEDSFDDYERIHENQLSGGHLEAQLHRFRRLWRAHFFIDRKLKASLSKELLSTLRIAIEKLVLGNIREDTNGDAARGIAAQLTSLPSSPWHGWKLKTEKVLAAYQDEGVALGSYPFGCGAIRGYLEE
jgi:HD superfamily phosphohydrolase